MLPIETCHSETGLHIKLICFASEGQEKIKKSWFRGQASCGLRGSEGLILYCFSFFSEFSLFEGQKKGLKLKILSCVTMVTTKQFQGMSPAQKYCKFNFQTLSIAFFNVWSGRLRWPTSAMAILNFNNNILWFSCQNQICDVDIIALLLIFPCQNFLSNVKTFFPMSKLYFPC